MAYNNFYNLDVWNEARRFKNLIYEIVEGFPPAERYELGKQLIRAARSIPSNLAEGHGRQTVKDEIHFCIMARGSWTECLNHRIDAKDCGMLSFERLAELKNDWDRLGKILNGYINFQRGQLGRGKRAETSTPETDEPQSEASEARYKYSASKNPCGRDSDLTDDSFKEIFIQ